MEIKTLFLVFIVLQATVQKVSTQAGESCAARIAELYPRQLLDLDKMTGEWMAIQMAWKNGSLIQPPWAQCASQILSRQTNSSNLNIKLKLDLIGSNHTHIERDGEVDITPSEPSIWKWRYFDNPAQFWYGVIIATDYDKYWIHYECEEQNGFRIETAVVRYRERIVGPEQRLIYESLLEGLGFPSTNYVDVPQPPSCNA